MLSICKSISVGSSNYYPMNLYKTSVLKLGIGNPTIIPIKSTMKTIFEFGNPAFLQRDNLPFSVYPESIPSLDIPREQVERVQITLGVPFLQGKVAEKKMYRLDLIKKEDPSFRKALISINSYRDLGNGLENFFNNYYDLDLSSIYQHIMRNEKGPQACHTQFYISRNSYYKIPNLKWGSSVNTSKEDMDLILTLFGSDILRDLDFEDSFAFPYIRIAVISKT